MFKQFKSALIWYYIYRFRGRVALILTLLFVIVFSQFIYGDIVQYLKLRNKLEWLDYILPIKWAIIIVSLFGIFYLLATMFQKKTKESDDKDKVQVRKPSKKEIRTIAQQLIESKKRKKI